MAKQLLYFDLRNLKADTRNVEQLIGDEPCTYLRVCDVLKQCSSAGTIWSKLVDLSRSLGLPEDRVAQVNSSLLIGSKTPLLILNEVLQNWRGKVSTNATLGNLTQALENLDLLDGAVALRKQFHPHIPETSYILPDFDFGATFHYYPTAQYQAISLPAFPVPQFHKISNESQSLEKIMNGQSFASLRSEPISVMKTSTTTIREPFLSSSSKPALPMLLRSCNEEKTEVVIEKPELVNKELTEEEILLLTIKSPFPLLISNPSVLRKTIQKVKSCKKSRLTIKSVINFVLSTGAILFVIRKYVIFSST